MSKDRFSIHQESGGSLIQEAFTIMRDGGTFSQSGLIGITNSGYPEGGQPILPETILNVQSQYASDVRFSSGPSGVGYPPIKSSLQLFGNGNVKASGLQITYLPNNDTAYWDGCTVNCNNNGSQFYRRYTLEKCDDQTFIDVIDRTFVRPAIGSVVNYTDADSNSSCATVNSYVLVQNEDGISSINSVYQDCISCEGGTNNDTTIYEILICGGTDGAQIYAEDPNGINPSVGQTVKYNDPQTGLQCGEVLSVTTGQSSAYITETYIDCNQCINPPDPPEGNTVYQVTNCTGGGTEYVEDDTSVSPQAGKIYGYNDGGSVTCATVVGVSNSNATKTGFVATQYDDCSSCDNSNNPTQTLQYTIGRCYDQTILDVIEDPFGVAPAVNAIVGYYNGTDVYCGQVISTAFGNQLGTSTYIRTLYTSCDSCNDNTNGGGTSGGGGSGGGGTNSGGGTGTQAGEYIFKVKHWYYEEFCNANPNDPCDPCCREADLWVASGSIIPSTIDLGYRVSFTYAGLAFDDELKVGFIKDSGINNGSQAIVGNITCVGNACGGAGSPICDENELCQPPGGGPGGGFGFVNDPYSMSDISLFVGDQEKNVVDFSVVRASGTEGIEFGHLSITERGYVGVGLTKIGDVRKFTANAPLTVAYMANNHRDSGTISMKEQSSAPNNNGCFGKIYVKPFTTGGRSQALYFKDDSGVETNLVLSQDLSINESTDGLIYGDTHGNTYGGWYTPETRAASSTITKNTLYGWAAGYDMSKGSPDFNTLVGYTAGSGATELQRNTVVGSNSLVKYGAGIGNVIVGYNNVNTAIVAPAENGFLPTSGIVIGTNLYVNSDPPTGVLAIGHGTPVVTGQLTGASRSFAVDDASFIVSTGDSILSINASLGGSKYTSLIDVRDEDSTGTTLKNNIKFNFSNSDSYTKTLFEINPQATERTNIPSYASQGFQYAQLDADFRLMGAIRFQDGSSLSGVADWFELGLYGTSGVSQVTESNGLWSVLDFSELELASVRSNDIRTDNTFVSVQLDGTASSNVGKMDLSELAGHISDSFVNIATNCNVIITDPSNEPNLDATANSESVFMGCGVATNASGWKNSVIIGTEAGKDAVTPNLTLATSTAAVFLGYRAGYDADSVDNTIFIGTSAGRNADAASDSTFIGASAGLDSSYNNSIGIGQNSLRGVGTGAGNIEIVTNLLDNQRLLYNAGNIDNKLNIQNVIAGDTGSRNLSIGDARLSPESPLEVRRDATVHGSNTNNFIQAWYCDDSLVGAVECDGSLSGFMIEGTLDGNLQPAASISSASPANLSVYYNGVDTGSTAVILNRDPNFSASAGDYILAVKMGGEYRPVTNNTGNGASIP